MTAGDLRWITGVVLLLAGWWLPRRAAGTALRFSWALPIDLLLPVTIFVLVLAMSARPVLAGTVMLAMGAGWAQADRDKRRVLGEPIVFTDIFQALDILRHPDLALPFPHKLRIVLAAAAVICFFGLLWRLEPAAWTSLRGSLVTAVAGLGLLWAIASGLLAWLAAKPGRLGLSADPARDAAAHGALATILLHASFARRQRAGLSTGLAPAASPATATANGGPVVLVQNESFFDVRRLQPGLLPGLLPHFDRCCREGVQSGRLVVPSWGANTVRTEFAVLSGLGQQALGFDRFNPYQDFVSRDIASLAWTLRAEGYRTICLHPFDRRFYRRDVVMPLLGFDEFLDEALFEGAARVNCFVADTEVARVAAELIRSHGPKVFIFIITMENHGPWSGVPDAAHDGLAALPLDETEKLALHRYNASLRNADTMLGLLSDALGQRSEPGILGFYGDHLPSFPSIYRKLGLQVPHSDYLIWHSRGGKGVQQDLAAENLGAAILKARQASVPQGP